MLNSSAPHLLTEQQHLSGSQHCWIEFTLPSDLDMSLNWVIWFYCYDQITPPLTMKSPGSRPFRGEMLYQGPALLLMLKAFWLKAFSRQCGCDWLMLKHQPITTKHSAKSLLTEVPVVLKCRLIMCSHYADIRKSVSVQLIKYYDCYR